MSATYATQADFEAYVEGWTTTDPDALERMLERAERDIDAILGPIPVSPLSTTGLKLDPSILKAWEAQALARAVCAQALYRHLTTDASIAAGRVTAKEKGPDFEVDYGQAGAGGNVPQYGQRVRTELAPIRHLRRLRAYIDQPAGIVD